MYLAYAFAFFFHCALLLGMHGPGYFGGGPPDIIGHCNLERSFCTCVALSGCPSANRKVPFF